MSKKVLITGAAGFVGHHLVEHILKNTDWRIICLDRLDTSGNINRLTDMDCWEAEKHRVQFFHHDLRAEINDQVARLLLMEAGSKMPVPFDYIMHLAAGSHVDRSISDPIGFIMDNVVGTGHMVNFVREYKDLALNMKDGGKFLYFSTDEVFGPAPDGVAFKEWDRFNTGNPYSAAKAGGECVIDAFANTYQIPCITTHCMNIFGERQHPEKFIPMCIKKILNDETVIIHSNKEKTKAGTRFYLHTRNVCDAVVYLLKNGPVLDGKATAGKYNLVGDLEVSNLEMAQMIAEILGKELKYEMVDFHSSRPGHDLRYALDGSLMKEIGWTPPVEFKESLRRTVLWMVAHKDKWLL